MVSCSPLWCFGRSWHRNPRDTHVASPCSRESRGISASACTASLESSFQLLGVQQVSESGHIVNQKPNHGDFGPPKWRWNDRIRRMWNIKDSTKSENTRDTPRPNESNERNGTVQPSSSALSESNESVLHPSTKQCLEEAPHVAVCFGLFVGPWGLELMFGEVICGRNR